MTITYVELPGFTAECLSAASDEELRQFQNDLAASPEDGDLIQHTGGLRKARFKLAGRGKSGSARVIYLWLPHVRTYQASQVQPQRRRQEGAPHRHSDHQTILPVMKTAPSKTADIAFDPQSLVARVQEFAAHAKRRKPLPLVRITEIKMPPAVKPLPPREIRNIRTRLGVSQSAFAALLNVPQKTAVSWESGARKPSGAALKLLQIVKQRPDILAGT